MGSSRKPTGSRRVPTTGQLATPISYQQLVLDYWGQILGPKLWAKIQREGLTYALDYYNFFVTIPDAYWDGDYYITIFDAPGAPRCAHSHLESLCGEIGRIDNRTDLYAFEKKILGESLFETTMRMEPGRKCRAHVLEQYGKLVEMGY